MFVINATLAAAEVDPSMIGITSKEWARLGAPLGLVTMLVFFIILYAPGYIS